MLWIQLVIVTLFALIHFYAGKLHFLDTIPRSRWLSFAGGISVAYVFIHVFPELAKAQAAVEETLSSLRWLEQHIYLVALAGLAAFYGVERLVVSARPGSGKNGEDDDDESEHSMGIFWLHIASFSLYNGLIGYLLVHREEDSVQSLIFFALAMAVHFLVNDFGLSQEHNKTYERSGRWILSAAIVVGWLIGLITAVSEAVFGLLFAFLAGGIVLNVLKEELPRERKSRFLPFALGCVVYTLLLLLL